MITMIANQKTSGMKKPISKSASSLTKAKKKTNRNTNNAANDWANLSDTPILSFSTEYQSDFEKEANEVLLYVYSLSYNNQHYSGIIPLPANRKRITFEQFVGLCIEQSIEKKILRTHPKSLFIVSPCLKSDLFNFLNADKTFDGALKSLNKSLYSSGQNNRIGIKNSQCSNTTLNIQTKSRNKKTVCVRLIDAALLAPTTKNELEAGELLGMPELPTVGSPRAGNVKEYQEKAPEEFIKYAIRKADTARIQFEQTIKLCVDKDIDQLPITIPSLSIMLFKKSMGDINILPIFGNKFTPSERFNQKTNRMQTIIEVTPTNMRRINESFLEPCYHGGRTEAFWLGLTPISHYYDFDIPSCYTTIMLGLRKLDYDNRIRSKQMTDLLGDKCAFAYVTFTFPDDTAYPCLPVRVNSSLSFPLTGESFCTGHELEVAIALNAEITIKEGLYIPWKDDRRIFEPFSSMVKKERNKHLKGSYMERLWKEIGNSLYGKLAQGVKDKNVFDIQSKQSTKLPMCELTNSAYAAYVTGLARAMLGEILNGIPREYDVISVSTDGFITNADLDKIPLNGPLCERFKTLHNSICPEEKKDIILELKHGANQLVCMKSRGQFTVIPMKDQPVIVAQAGVQAPFGCLDRNQFIGDLYKNRTPTSTTKTLHMTPTRQIFLNEKEVMTLEKDKRLNLEYDCKRKIHSPKTFKAQDWSHVGCKTKPFVSEQEMIETNAFFKEFKRDRCLKTVQDVEDFTEYLAMQKSTTGKGLNIKKDEKPDELLIRVFLRFYSNSLLGLNADGLNSVQMSKWLKTMGYDITPNLIRKAKSKPIVEHVVPKTIRSQKCYELLQQKFPNAELETLFYSE